MKQNPRVSITRYRLFGTVPCFFAPRDLSLVLPLVDLTFCTSFLDSDMTSASLAFTRCLISRSSPVSGISSPPQQRKVAMLSALLGNGTFAASQG